MARSRLPKHSDAKESRDIGIVKGIKELIRVSFKQSQLRRKQATTMSTKVSGLFLSLPRDVVADSWGLADGPAPVKRNDISD